MSSGTNYHCYYIGGEYLDKIPLDIAYPESVGAGKDVICPNLALYAVTTSDKYAKHFEVTHNMKYFVKRDVWINKEDRESFDTDTSSFRINKHPFRSELRVDGVLMECDAVIEVPTFEHDLIADQGEIIFEDMVVDIEDRIQTHSVIELLTSGFLTTFTYDYRKIFSKIYFSDLLNDSFPSEVPWTVYTSLNQLMLYAHIYGGLYNKEGIITLCKFGDFISLNQRQVNSTSGEMEP